ncbi:MAG: hypothetical protein WCE46_02110 [Methanoregula sp.]|jgi:hypothetical protein|uniref:hypothetical protein n=1 Tax=Methanoregula sp. TaxID=2052170 RepID=UPI003C776201
MAKLIPLEMRAFGAEPGIPDVAALAKWISGHRGIAADLTAYLLDRSLEPQIAAGITQPCAGGLFYRDRVRGSLCGLFEDVVTDEIGAETGMISGDAGFITAQKKRTWCAIPAPHELGITDRYYHDEDEWNDALAGAYRTIMRAMRDAGIGGHVILCGKMNEAEIALLARDNVFFFPTEPDEESLRILMEYQRRVAVNKKMLDTVFDLSNEYDLHQLVVMDPNDEAVSLALSHLDPDQVMAGGYCTDACETYWENLVKTAIYRK